MKNAGKACNNRLYRHIRTFEKIVKNYFVICDKFMIIYKQVCESLEKTENGKFDERKLGRETVRSWARKKNK